jgi:uncharacterized protein Yka (UPF0111/DUF47 family)
MKSEIVEQLGQADLLLPARIAEGLEANDRVKARLSILQAAAHHAQTPNGAPFDLAEECRAAGIDALAMERLVGSARVSADGRLSASGLANLRAAISQDVAAMAQAVRFADPGRGDQGLERLSAVDRDAPLPAADDMDVALVARLTALAGSDGGTLHRLVMDLHKMLNALAAANAEEVVAGAHVRGLRSGDRSAVEAFMRGVNATAPLKFGHPGLATTAARSGERFTIQNDIGETDAHVIVIAVTSDAVTVTYTDVHLVRARFFAGLFRDFPVQWSGLERKSVSGLSDDGAFYLITGRLQTDGAQSRDTFLETLGASLVFLIDWNKARKLLRTWVSKSESVQILEWAARHRFGHRGFLVLGGSELVAAAVRHAAPARIGFGEPLESALGRTGAIDFLKTVLRVSTEALLQGSSVRLARDRIEADLVRHLQRVDAALLATVIRQAGLAREIAAGLDQIVTEWRLGQPVSGAALAKKAERIEQKADLIAVEVRGEIDRLDADRGVERLVNRIEDAIDELEQAAFVASLVPSELNADLFDPLKALCAAAVSGTEAAAAGVAAAVEVPEGHRVDTEDALAAVSRLIDAEHAADAAERKLTATILQGECNLKTALSAIELARALERATDRLAAFGHQLREHVLTDLST